MDVVAKLRYFRVSPRKVRLVLDLIRGLNVEIAEQQLMNLPKASSLPLLKLMRSAQANAEHNFKLNKNDLYVKQAFADEGPKLKRFMPRAMGRATPVLKRMSHVTIILAPTASRMKGIPAPHSKKGTVKPAVKPAIVSAKPASKKSSIKPAKPNKEHKK